MSFWSKLKELFVGKGAPRLVAPCFTTVANTGSMEPEFTGGDSVYIQPADFETLSIGQVVVAYWEGRKINVMHKILARRGEPGNQVYVTKGSANMYRDPHILTKENFIGVATKVNKLT